MKLNFIKFLIIPALTLPVFYVSAQTTNFEVSGWVPYWRSKEGIESILPNLGKFTEVNPFVYTVRLNGTLFLNSALSGVEWTKLRTLANEMNIRFIPTVTWGNSDAIDDILKSPEKRQAHIRSIATEVYKNDFHGIDIDYEAKYARTRPYFSLFLKELKEAIGYDKWIMCTIEARTPLDARYSSLEAIPTDIEFANDFSEINRYCDRVRIMTYDQGRIDLKLNQANTHPYIPVSDILWVEKVVRLAMAEISKDKILIGVPTYGYEYDMFTSLTGSGQTEYSRLWSFNPGYALNHAQTLNLKPTRNSAGELFLVYPAKDSPDPVIPLPFANRVMSWSDAEAIRQKAELAKKLGVRGISIFRIDGGQDPALWDVLSKYPSLKDGKKTPTLVFETSSALTVPSGDLSFGARGEDVRTLQKLLNEKGFTVASGGPGSPGKETVTFGPATRSALIRFQKERGIAPAVGYYGPITRASFQSI